MTASPAPIRACTPSIAGSTVPSGTVPESASSTDGRRGADHHREPGAGAGDRERVSGARRAARACAAAISPPTASPPSTPMLRMFAPSAVTPPSANTKACTTRTTAEDHPREPRAEQDRRERRAEEMAARAARDGEVEHLRGEHERGRDAEQRGAAVVELALGAPQAVGDRAAAGTAQASATSLDRKPSGMCMAHLGESGGSDLQRGQRPTTGKWTSRASKPQASATMASTRIIALEVQRRERRRSARTPHSRRRGGWRASSAPRRGRHGRGGRGPRARAPRGCGRRRPRSVRRHAPAEAAGDLLGADRGVGGEQRLDHDAAGARDAQAAGAQRRQRSGS